MIWLFLLALLLLLANKAKLVIPKVRMKCGMHIFIQCIFNIGGMEEHW